MQPAPAPGMWRVLLLSIMCTCCCCIVRLITRFIEGVGKCVRWSGGIGAKAGRGIEWSHSWGREISARACVVNVASLACIRGASHPISATAASQHPVALLPT
jgi:hypothetical protein